MPDEYVKARIEHWVRWRKRRVYQLGYPGRAPYYVEGKPIPPPKRPRARIFQPWKRLAWKIQRAFILPERDDPRAEEVESLVQRMPEGVRSVFIHHYTALGTVEQKARDLDISSWTYRIYREEGEKILFRELSA